MPVLEKIIEKHVKAELVSYFEDCSLFFDNQFGFRTNRSVHDAIFTLTEEILRARNNNLNTCCAYLDLSKDFNCVSHSLLLKKLNHYGVTGNFLNGLKTSSLT